MGDKCRSQCRAERGALQHPPLHSGLRSSCRCVPGWRELVAPVLRINSVMKKLESDYCKCWGAMLHSPQARLLDSASCHLSRITAGSSQGLWEPAALTTRPGELDRLLATATYTGPSEHGAVVPTPEGTGLPGTTDTQAQPWRDRQRARLMLEEAGTSWALAEVRGCSW